MGNLGLLISPVADVQCIYKSCENYLWQTSGTGSALFSPLLHSNLTGIGKMNPVWDKLGQVAGLQRVV